jgi:hypothetical protein
MSEDSTCREVSGLRLKCDIVRKMMIFRLYNPNQSQLEQID